MLCSTETERISSSSLASCLTNDSKEWCSTAVALQRMNSLRRFPCTEMSRNRGKSRPAGRGAGGAGPAAGGPGATCRAAAAASMDRGVVALRVEAALPSAPALSPCFSLFGLDPLSRVRRERGALLGCFPPQFFIRRARLQYSTQQAAVEPERVSGLYIFSGSRIAECHGAAAGLGRLGGQRLEPRRQRRQSVWNSVVFGLAGALSGLIWSAAFPPGQQGRAPACPDGQECISRRFTHRERPDWAFAGDLPFHFLLESLGRPRGRCIPSGARGSHVTRARGQAKSARPPLCPAGLLCLRDGASRLIDRAFPSPASPSAQEPSYSSVPQGGNVRVLEAATSVLEEKLAAVSLEASSANQTRIMLEARRRSAPSSPGCRAGAAPARARMNSHSHSRH